MICILDAQYEDANLSGSCEINPRKFNPESPNVDIELINVPDELAYEYDAIYELLESIITVSIGGIEIALEDYAHLSLGNFGFNYFDDETMYVGDIELCGLYRNNYQWNYYEDNEIYTDYVGVEYNSFGFWYVSDGEIDFSYNGLYGNDYIIKNGKVDENANGLIKVDGIWVYADEGFIDYDYEGLAQNAYGWWYVKNGTIDFSYNGTASNKYGTWKVVNGKVVTK